MYRKLLYKNLYVKIITRVSYDTIGDGVFSINMTLIHTILTIIPIVM